MTVPESSPRSPRLPRASARGASVVNLLVFLAVAAGLVFGGRMLWRRVRLSGYNVERSAIVAPPGTVVLYTKNHCGMSKRAMKLLADAGIAYEERNIDLTPSAREDLRALEAGGVPVIVIGDRKIVGWNEDAYAYFVEAAGFK